jgi:hypothetical protein
MHSSSREARANSSVTSLPPIRPSTSAVAARTIADSSPSVRASRERPTAGSSAAPTPNTEGTRTCSFGECKPSLKTRAAADPNPSSASYTMPAPTRPGCMYSSASAGRARTSPIRPSARAAASRTPRLRSVSRSISTGTASSAPATPSILMASARRQGGQRRAERSSTSIAPTCRSHASVVSRSSGDATSSRSNMIEAAIGRSSSLKRLSFRRTSPVSPSVPGPCSASSCWIRARKCSARYSRERSRNRRMCTTAITSRFITSSTPMTMSATTQNHVCFPVVTARTPSRVIVQLHSIRCL